MPDAKHLRFKRKRNDAERATEAGVKSAQGVAALIIGKADPKPPRKP
jgi:hypothetical protein